MPRFGTFLKLPRSTQDAMLTSSNCESVFRTLSVAIQPGAYLTLRVLVEMSDCTGDHIYICPFCALKVFWIVVLDETAKMDDM
jgi:hypothetical protein